MLRVLRYLFLGYALLGSVIGLACVIVPGRFMELVGWPNLDPILYRVLGATLVALAWSSFRGAQVQESRNAQPYVDVQVFFSTLAALGVWRHLLTGAYFASYVWILAWGLTLLAVIWIVVWVMLVLAPASSTRSGEPGIRIR
ncbi:MAG: hypothetical protein WCF84_08955 [Anaerolineae bacterium]